MLLFYLFSSCFLTCVLSGEDFYFGEFEGAQWPSHGTAKLLAKRQAEVQPGEIGVLSKEVNPKDSGLKTDDKAVLQASHSEGGVQEVNLISTAATPVNTTSNHTESSPALPSSPKPGLSKGNESLSINASSTASPPTKTPSDAPPKLPPPKAPSYQADLSNPGVVKRGLIVFGGFAVMAIAYFIFYRTKGKSNESNNTHGTNDTNQFRYGVLQSEDRRDNLELSRILTAESDEDEDEDLEIFDLEQKKKSLSYVNLQTNDDYVVHGSRENLTDRDNLLLDIEDANSDTLINWSSSGNKSIL